MGSIRRHESKGTLFMDFRHAGQRLREYTTLPDNVSNRKRLQKALDRIEAEIALGGFDYEKTFGKPLPAQACAAEATPAGSSALFQNTKSGTPLFKAFAEQWFTEAEVSWRRSYTITQRGALDKYLIPFFGEKEVGQINKAEVLAFRAHLSKVTVRKSEATLSNRRINSVLKPLRQILNEAADRFEFNSAFRNVKPLKIKRSDVSPFSLARPLRFGWHLVKRLNGLLGSWATPAPKCCSGFTAATFPTSPGAMARRWRDCWHSTSRSPQSREPWSVCLRRRRRAHPGARRIGCSN